MHLISGEEGEKTCHGKINHMNMQILCLILFEIVRKMLTF
jgi:hypothetical protein